MRDLSPDILSGMVWAATTGIVTPIAILFITVREVLQAVLPVSLSVYIIILNGFIGTQVNAIFVRCCTLYLSLSVLLSQTYK
jgi:hypothetical protein